MQVRRCAVLYLEPREELRFQLEDLLSDNAGLASSHRWVALAPHLQIEVELAAEEISTLSRLPQEQWTELSAVQLAWPQQLIERWLDQGLLISDQPEQASHRAHAEADCQVRKTGWHPLFATAHIFGRWQNVDSPLLAENAGLTDLDEQLRRLGPPPPATVDRGRTEQAIELPACQSTEFDRLLSQRATCRNFDPNAPARMADVSVLLQRVFSAQLVHSLRPGHQVLRKTSPSGGCLHPIEAHVLAARVEGLDPGIYHYRPTEHSLSPIALGDGDQLERLILRGLAGQTWFAQAAVSVVLSCRFDRHYWKYRQHAKAYRAMMFDAGHLSQTLYLSAAELGLGAYVTAAINEEPLETSLGLNALQEGVIAMCGFGPRSQQRTEFDFAAAPPP